MGISGVMSAQLEVGALDSWDPRMKLPLVEWRCLRAKMSIPP